MGQLKFTLRRLLDDNIRRLRRDAVSRAYQHVLFGAGREQRVAVDDRFLYNVAAYYGRGYFGTPEAPPLRMWVHEIAPRNQAEVEAPLDAALGRRALIASLDGVYRGKIQQDFKATSDLQIVSVRLDRKRSRRTDLFIAQGFAPVPRDPVTGLPPDTPWRDPGK